MPETLLEAPLAPVDFTGRGPLLPGGDQRPPKPPPWAAVLARFYERLGRPLPEMDRLEARQLPQPYRQLLAHNNDMTLTLERFHGEAVSLRVHSREYGESAYWREVVLALEQRGAPVEYGAIGIYLHRFPERVREIILAEEHPFGRILQTEGIAHLGWPQAYFRLWPDGHVKQLLNLRNLRPLYGRRNVLLNGRRQLLAEVIEILAPLPLGDDQPRKRSGAVGSGDPGLRERNDHVNR